jgi:predicted O-linked N-acetylglucosamine transferase (SPINDLY family)
MLDWLRSLWPTGGGGGSDPLALYHAGAAAEAERIANERLARDAGDRAAALTQALLLVDRGHGRDAIAIADRVLAGAREDGDALLVIGRAHAAAGRRKPAAEALLSAARVRDGAPVRAELALLALAEGRPEEAAQHLERARGANKRMGQAHAELAETLLARGQGDLAQKHLRQAIAADATHASAHANLGALLKDHGRPQEAVTALERALALQPGLPSAAYNLAMLRIDQRDWSAAAALLRTYLSTQQRDADAQYWLGNALMGEGDAAAARAAYQAAIRIDGKHVRARWGLAMAQLPAIAQDAQEQQAAVPAFGAELDKLRAWSAAHPKVEAQQAVGAQQPFFLAYIPGDHRAVLERYGALCSEWMAAWARKVKVPAPAAASGGTLRVGIVSAHIHRHSVWDALLRGWVEHLDRSRFELHLFHTGTAQDAQTKWAAAQVKQLHQGAGDWMAWAKVLSDARLDVLVYPEIGMDSTTVRLAALRLARVQLAGWGHPLTTGLPTIDGYVSAEAFEPPGAQAYYSEKLLALPRLGCAYRPYGTAPEAVDLRPWGIAPDDRLLVAPGAAFKYAPAEDALWAAVARRCAPCKLVFFRGNAQHAQAFEQRLRAAFAAAGVDFDASVRFLPWQPQAAFFGLLQRADVFLDTVGFSGFNTAMQAVECGTPMVAWEGSFLRGRFASGILRALGLQEWIATTHEAYADKVARLCGDAALRKDVRAQIAARRAALYDDRESVQAFAEALERLA